MSMAVLPERTVQVRAGTVAVAVVCSRRRRPFFHLGMAPLLVSRSVMAIMFLTPLCAWPAPGRLQTSRARSYHDV